MKTLDQLKVKIFADGADLDAILELYRNPHITGFTTNPTLMRKSGITDYEKFARQVLEKIPDRPISFEVFQMNLLRWNVRRGKLPHGGITCMSKFL